MSFIQTSAISAICLHLPEEWLICDIAHNSFKMDKIDMIEQ